MFGIITKPIGCLISLLGTLVFLGLLFVVAVFAGVKYGLPFIAEKVVEQQTSFPLHVGQNDSSILDARLDFKEINLSNPAGYPSSDFLILNELVVDLNTEGTQENKFVLDEVVLDVGLLSWVENANGVGNAVQFVEALQAGEDTTQQQESEPMPEYLIHTLVIRIDRVSIMRNGKDARSYMVDYQRTFENVSDVKQVVSAVSRDLAGDGLTVFKDVLVDYVFDKRHLENIGGAAKTLTDQATEGGKQVIEGGKDVVDGAADKIKNLF